MWYALSKTLAERYFYEWADAHPAVSCASVLPSWTIGPLLDASHAANPTIKPWLECVNDNWIYVPNSDFAPIDVRDVALVHVK